MQIFDHENIKKMKKKDQAGRDPHGKGCHAGGMPPILADRLSDTIRCKERTEKSPLSKRETGNLMPK